MKVAIATTSKEKIRGIVKGFSRFFQIEETEIEVIFQKTNSNVPDQPFNSEIYIGAKNRVNNIKKELTEICDFYVSCEAGIESFSDCYFNVQVICIFESKNQKYLFGKSAGWQLPSKDIALIKNFTLDTYLIKEKGISKIEELLGSTYSRNESIAQATELALRGRKL